MAKRKWEARDEAWDGKDAYHPCLPMTPVLQKRRKRRDSDVIDSMGESPDSAYLSAARRPTRSAFGSPAHCSSSLASSPAGSATPGTPASTPRRPPARGAADWNDMNSPDLRFSTLDYSHPVTDTPVFTSRSFESHFDAGPATPDIPCPRIASRASGTISSRKGDERYNMSHPRRGKCVIFNHEKFDTGLSSRQGSRADVNRIQQTKTKLGFDVEIHQDLEFASLKQKIDQLAAEDHSENDCLCIYVLTHGLKNNLIFAKDVAYSFETIWKPFTAENCVTLAGKPKLFFIQACRGDDLDYGVDLHKKTSTSETDSHHAYKIPTHADFLFAHSTVEGYCSWRDIMEGTWYIQSLCKVLDEYASTKDLGSMLTMVSRVVAEDFVSECGNPLYNGMKQVPMVTSTLIRDLYFTSNSE